LRLFNANLPIKSSIDLYLRATRLTALSTRYVTTGNNNEADMSF